MRIKFLEDVEIVGELSVSQGSGTDGYERKAKFLANKWYQCDGGQREPETDEILVYMDIPSHKIEEAVFCFTLSPEMTKKSVVEDKKVPKKIYPEFV